MSDDDCITIDSDEEEIRDRRTKLVAKLENERSNFLKNGKHYAQLQTISGTDLFEQFLVKCKATIKPVADAERGIRKLRKRFAEVDPSYKNDKSFTNLLQNTTPKILKEPWQSMKKIMDELKFHSIKNSVENHPANETESPSDNRAKVIDRRTRKQIAKLNFTLSKLHSKIKELEAREVDFVDTDDEDSNYIRVSRYKTRFCQVHGKICELERLGGDDNSKKIRFSGTKIPSVNRAIERFYNENKEFPDYLDIYKVVKLVNDRRQLGLAEIQIHDTAKIAFEELGQTLKRQRQYDFHDALCSYLPDQLVDPATVDDELSEKLLENKRLHGHKIDEIINKYAAQQDENHLEATEVDSREDSVSENEEDDDDDDDDDEDELVTSASEYEMDDEPEDKKPMRLFTIELSDVTKLPVWDQYRPMKIESLDNQQPCCSKSLLTSTTNSKKRGSDSDSSDFTPHEPKKSRLCVSGKMVTSTPLPKSVLKEKHVQKKISSPAIVNLDSIENIIVSCENGSDEEILPVKHGERSRPSKSDKEIEESPSADIVINKTDTNISKGFDGTVVEISESDNQNSELSTFEKAKLKFAGSNFEKELKTSVNDDVIEVNSKNVPNGVLSPPQKTENDSLRNNDDDDDDVVIIDEIPSKNKTKTVAKPYSNEIIDVDKLDNTSGIQRGNSANIDLGAFIKNMNLVLPQGTSLAPFKGKANAQSVRPPLLTNMSLAPRPNIPPSRKIMVRPNLVNGPRMMQPSRMTFTNHMRSSLIQNRNAFVNQSMQSRRMQMRNEVRLMQNNQIIARKTTTVEESFVQVSAAYSSQMSNRGFSGAFRNNAYSSTLQTTRRLMTTNHTSRTQMKNAPTEELVYLD